MHERDSAHSALHAERGRHGSGAEHSTDQDQDPAAAAGGGHEPVPAGRHGPGPRGRGRTREHRRVLAADRGAGAGGCDLRRRPDAGADDPAAVHHDVPRRRAPARRAAHGRPHGGARGRRPRAGPRPARGCHPRRRRRRQHDRVHLRAHRGELPAPAGPRRRRPEVRCQRRRRLAERVTGHPPQPAVRRPGRRGPAGPAAAGRAGQPARDGPGRRHRDRRPRGLQGPAGVHRGLRDRGPLPGPPGPGDHHARPRRPGRAHAGGPALLHAARPVPDRHRGGPGRRRARRRPARLPPRGCGRRA